MKQHTLLRRLTGTALVATLLAAAACPAYAGAANKTLLQAQAQAQAIANSSDISKQTNEITLQKIKYVEAVDAIKAKVKNLTSFRWTPLLSFKFPEKLDLTEEYDMQIKPITLQADITTMQHELADLRYAALLEVNTAYLEAYVLQEKIASTEERLEAAKTELERNQLRLRTGDATQADIDKMQKSVETIETELTTQKRNFETAKSNLSDIIGMDVTTGYTFANSMFTAAIPREKLEEITAYTLENDHGYCAAKMSASTALLNLNAYESLMRNQYGGKLNRIMSFVNAAKNGQDIDYAAFQIAYKEMLTDLDRPWAGKFRILFFSFTKEWLKGEISGTRYIENEMYALYTACMEYANAKTEQDSTEEALRKEVATQYENIVSAENAYRAMQKSASDLKSDYDQLLALNQLGKATYEEVSDKLEEYQAAQIETIDLLSDYNELLYSFDRLTCGAVTKYFKGESLTTDSGSAADSFAEIDTPDGAYYHLYTSVEDMVFTFGVEVPDGYTPEVTHFELWYEGQQIGERTPIEQEIRHLALDYGETSTLTLRMYNGDEFVGECEIDARVPRDTIDFFQGSATETEEKIGTYTMSAEKIGDMAMTELEFSIDASVGAAYFLVTYDDGKAVGTSEPTALDSSLRYMTMLAASVEDIRVVLYDSGRNEICTAYLKETGQTVWRSTEE
nr:TolC family protein [uncultured Agathobaculum sp.]